MSLKLMMPHDALNIPIGEMRINDIGIIIKGEDHEGAIILRTYDSFVSLSDANHTWNGIPSFRVNLLPKGTTFVLE